MIALAYGAFVVDHPLVAAAFAGVYRVVERAVADARIVHGPYDLHHYLHVLLSLAVELHVGDVAAERLRMEGRF